MDSQEQQSQERRKKQRFPIRRELRYKVMDGRVVIASGTGSTLDLGSGGAYFTTQGELELGATVELSISWPVLLDGSCPLRLVTSGKVVRSAGNLTACTIGKFEYRTQGKLTLVPATTQSPVWAKSGAKPIAAAC